tara:strand:+ start:609 stop:1079 length:471 start_codon:yes stop_codon:yes gene_type:complete
MSGLINSAGSRSGVIGTTELDYEEGVLSPVVLTVESGSVTMKSAEDTLAYTKIGNRVFLTGKIELSSVSTPSTPTGWFTMSIPFAVGDVADFGERIGTLVPGGDWTGSLSGVPGFTTTAGSTTLYGYDFADGAAGNIADHMTSNTFFFININYITA